MKELSIEGKAKRYDETIEQLRAMMPNWENLSYNGKTFLQDLVHIIPELKESKESEDEKIREDIISYLKSSTAISPKTWIAWLEEQGKHANFRNKIQVGDKVTRNEDGVLVNLSQLKRIAKPAENKGKHGMGISEATKQKLEDNLNKALEKETPESWNKFLDEQGEQKPFGKRDECLNCQFNYAGECKGFCAMKRSNRKPHKPADTPKFKVGDWVVSPNGVYWHIDKISNNRYEVTSDTGASSNWPLDTNIYHGFSIQDAKDGDVLSYRNGQWIFIFKEIENNKSIIKYFALLSERGLEIKDAASTSLISAILPATKEQRDLLFQKIKDAGYEWDAEKKELKKIEEKKDIHNKLTAFEFSLKHIIEEAIECGDIHNLKADADLLLRIARKTSWSEEDEARLKSVISLMKSNRAVDPFYDKTHLENWLKSLKDRVGCEVNCTTTKERSEEDNRMYNKIVSFIPQHLTAESYTACITWLKSLKDRYAWKPSEEQMKTLEYYMLSLICNKHKEILFGLYSDLKKLRKE